MSKSQTQASKANGKTVTNREVELTGRRTGRSCEECTDSRSVVTREHETYCQACGLVLEENWLDVSPSGRLEVDDETERKPITSVTIHDKGLGTTIGNAKEISRYTRSRDPGRLFRLKEAHQIARRENEQDRTRRDAFARIKGVIGQLELSRSVHERACFIYKQAQEAGLLAGRTSRGFVRASIRFASNELGYPLLPGELDEFTHGTKAEEQKATSALVSGLDLSRPVVNPIYYVGRLCSAVDRSTGADLPYSVQRQARQRIGAAPASLISGCNPVGVAGAAVHRAAVDAGIDLSRTAVAEVVNLSSETLRLRSKDLEEVVW